MLKVEQNPKRIDSKLCIISKPVLKHERMFVFIFKEKKPHECLGKVHSHWDLITHAHAHAHAHAHFVCVFVILNPHTQSSTNTVFLKIIVSPTVDVF